MEEGEERGKRREEGGGECVNECIVNLQVKVHVVIPGLLQLYPDRAIVEAAQDFVKVFGY